MLEGETCGTHRSGIRSFVRGFQPLGHSLIRSIVHALFQPFAHSSFESTGSLIVSTIRPRIIPTNVHRNYQPSYPITNQITMQAHLLLSLFLTATLTAALPSLSLPLTRGNPESGQLGTVQQSPRYRIAQGPRQRQPAEIYDGTKQVLFCMPYTKKCDACYDLPRSSRHMDKLQQEMRLPAQTDHRRWKELRGPMSDSDLDRLDRKIKQASSLDGRVRFFFIIPLFLACQLHPA